MELNQKEIKGGVLIKYEKLFSYLFNIPPLLRIALRI
jgi:hypothetical protein